MQTMTRTKAAAAITAGVLATSSVLPPIALAEQDREEDGTAVVTPGQQNEPADVTFDPGGGATALPETPTVNPAAPASPPPSASAPATAAPDEVDTVVDAGDGADPPDVVPTPPSPDPATAQAPPAEPAAPATPAPASSVEVPPAQTPPRAAAISPTVASGEAESQERRVHRHLVRQRDKRVRRTAVARPMRVTTPVATPAAVVRLRAIPIALRAKPGDRTHVVRAGESLWTIATDVLGAGATTAAISRKVDQLWMRNRAAIGTGDRDLLLVGTKLDLR